MSASPSLDAVTALVPFLRGRRDEPEVGDVTGAELIADPELLAAVIVASDEARGSDDRQVLASLWWQGYCYRVAGTTLAAWAVAGSAPDPSVDAGAGVGVARGRPSSLVVGSTATEVSDLESLLERLFNGHLDLLFGRLHEQQPIGSRLLWGDAAAAIASCLSAVATAEGAPPVLHGYVDLVMAQLPHELAELGSWLEPEHRGYRRTTCCLWWKTTTSGGHYCEDCSLLPPPPPAPDPDLDA